MDQSLIREMKHKDLNRNTSIYDEGSIKHGAQRTKWINKVGDDSDKVYCAIYKE